MSSSELRKQIDNYIDESITLEALEEWYVPRLPEFLADPNSADAELIAVLELVLAEYSAGIHDEGAVRKQLAEALREEQFIVVFERQNFKISTFASQAETKHSKILLGSGALQYS